MGRFGSWCILLAIGLLGACGYSENPTPALSADPYIRGTIVAINPGNTPGSMRIDIDNDDDPTRLVARVVVMPITVLIRHEQSTELPWLPSDLMIGQSVAIWFTGPILDSSPVHGTAAKVAVNYP